MSLRLVPLTDQDIRLRCAGEVDSTQDIQKPVALKQLDEFMISKASAHVRYYIQLNLPVINKLFTNSIVTILNLKQEVVDGLCDCSMCYDTDYDEVALTAEVYEGSKLFNGQALERIISNFSIAEAITDLLDVVVSKLKYKDLAYSYSDSEGIPIYGCWKLKVESTVDIGYIYTKLETIRNAKNNRSLFNRLSTLTNLYNSMRNEDMVREYLMNAFILRKLVVVPYAMRPQDEKRNHPLTYAYLQLFRHNNDFSIYREGTEIEFQDYYKQLAKYVYGITVKNVWEDEYSTVAKKLKKTKPIVEELKGKNGHIRGKMIKKRQDYSGRSAVVVDPFLSLDTLGVPKHLLCKMFREYAIRLCGYKSEDILAGLDDPDFNDKMIRDLAAKGVFDEVPILMGRNPTLHKLSIQAFRIKPVDGLATRVSPLVCPAYNMDFDGDTAWEAIPVTSQAIREVNSLMLTQKNILLPKTGESTICPRMDIVYGLYMCTTSKVSSGKTATYSDREELWQAIYKQEIMLGDTVTVADRGTNTAGVLAFECCFPKGVITGIGKTEVITSKTVKKYIKAIQDFSPASFVNIINHIVELGFRVAYLYCHSVSMLKELDSTTDKAKAFDEAYAKYHAAMEAVNRLNDYGFYDEDSYNLEFSEKLKDVMDALKDGVYDKVGDDSMFTLMAKSGARGDVKNLVQIFGSKGRVQKSDTELFNVTIEHSLRDQLTPLEGFIAANGARKGQIAKSIKTADTGYLGYLIIQATSPIVIVEEDCGTTEGITISWDLIREYLNRPNMQEKDKRDADEEADKIMSMFISGRYTPDGEYISPNRAKMHNRKPVVIRSPLKCKNPCCAKCYGLDPSTGRPVKVGAPVGYTAGQSLAEQCTQTTLKEFQGGGVQAASSPFEKLRAVLSCSNLRKIADEGKYTTYDPIAWADGKIVCEKITDMSTRVRIVSDGKKRGNYGATIVVPSVEKFKETHVNIGDTMLEQRGEFAASEALTHWGYDRTREEYVNMLWFLFKSTVEMVPIHLEITVAAMSGHVPLVTDITGLKVGVHYTDKQLKNLGYDYSGTIFRHEITGVKDTVLSGPDFMQAMSDEQVKKSLQSAISNCKVDTIDAPLVQTALARPIRVGTGFTPNYMEN